MVCLTDPVSTSEIFTEDMSGKGNRKEGRKMEIRK